MEDKRIDTISFKVTKKEFEVINQICESLQISKSDFIRKLISDYLWEWLNYVGWRYKR